MSAKTLKNSALKVLTILILLTSCGNVGNESSSDVDKDEVHSSSKEAYELFKPLSEQKGVLILFGGYPENTEDIKREFNITDEAISKGIAVVYMNFNRKLWMNESEKLELSDVLLTMFEEHGVAKTNIYLGGFSSGGNVALLMGDFLIEKQSKIQPTGIFIIDSPIDLAALYRSSRKNLARNFSEPSVNESRWLVETLGKEFGNPEEDIAKYQSFAVYTSETKNFSNINNLKSVRLRFYTEPDTTWWKRNRQADYDQMNAYYLEELSNVLKSSGFRQVDYIATENRGYRSNGDRHPHSWSIVDKKELLNWMTKP